MKHIATALIIICSLHQSISAQAPAPWQKWDWLIGQWQGDGNGKSGVGYGNFTFAFDLDKKILVRKNHTEYPSTTSKPAFTHDDLMVVYLDTHKQPTKASYFDNEGHVIDYNIAYAQKEIILISTPADDGAVFRLTYTLIEPGIIGVKFEVAADGQKFTTYLDGRCIKVM